MSDTEIRHAAARKLANNSGDCFSLMMFQFSLIALVLLCESTLYLALRSVGYNWLYSIKALMSWKASTWLFWVSKTLFELSVTSPFFGLVRRLYVDIAADNDMSETRAYISAHSVKYYSNTFYNTFILLFIKLTALTPGLLFAYNIYYWSVQITLHELSSAALFALTASLSMTAVWTFLTARYFISLSLTPYIIALNPRMNIFDACDLSVKLMEDKHGRYISFVIYFVKFLPTLIFVYPIFAFYPYFKVSYSLFMREMLGDRSTDKLPGMIRWKKYL